MSDLPDHESIDRSYNQIRDRGEGNGVGTLTDDTLEAGQYFANGIAGGGGDELDVSDEDIGILVGGGVSTGGNEELTSSTP